MARDDTKQKVKPGVQALKERRDEIQSILDYIGRLASHYDIQEEPLLTQDESLPLRRSGEKNHK